MALDTAKEVGVPAHKICDDRTWTQTALLSNGLGTPWNGLEAAAKTVADRADTEQLQFELTSEER